MGFMCDIHARTGVCRVLVLASNYANVFCLGKRRLLIRCGFADNQEMGLDSNDAHAIVYQVASGRAGIYVHSIEKVLGLEKSIRPF